MSGRILGVAGVILWTSDAGFPAMVQFYRDTLGLPLRHLKPDFCNFAWGEFRLSISIHRGLGGATLDPLRTMVNFTVDDIRAVHAGLLAKGVEFVRPPEREEWGGLVATFRDPDGNLGQFFEFPTAAQG